MFTVDTEGDVSLFPIAPKVGLMGPKACTMWSMSHLWSIGMFGELNSSILKKS